MPPKGIRGKSKLYSLAVSLSPGTTITDTRKQCFIIEKEFAQGGFGRIYSEYGKTGSLAIKVEPKGNGPLFTEITVFQRILKQDLMKEYKEKHGVEHLGLPPHLGSGVFIYEGEELRFLAMPKYGCSFENYRVKCGGKVALDVVIAVASQCADCLAYMQEQHMIFFALELIFKRTQDIKTANILLANVKNFSKCYLVDFGLARMIKSNVDKPDKKRAHNGTLMFTSTDAHRGCNPSPRGDLEILIYNILFWTTGSLPWQKLENNAESVFAKKLEFLKDVEMNVKTFLKGDIATCIINLLKIVHETPYTSKIDYVAVKKVS
uniref:Protein kinase domain-containing protein n=1 Tax=Syphacia muris TaxID=451379 RepID=A0A0N5A7Y1_9BILA